MNELYTRRLHLRAMTDDDADDIYEYASNKNVGPNAGWKPHESREETIAVMKAIFLDKESVWGIVLKESNKLIGSIGLVQDPKRENDAARMMGYSLGEQYWGVGYTTEAAREVVRYGFNELKLKLISAYCYPFNERSKSVLKKCGFIYEGTLKLAERIYNGNVYDNECYALTAQDYLKGLE